MKAGSIMSDEHKALISKIHKGKIVSDETKARMSAAKKKMWAELKAGKALLKENEGE